MPPPQPPPHTLKPSTQNNITPERSKTLCSSLKVARNLWNTPLWGPCANYVTLRVCDSFLRWRTSMCTQHSVCRDRREPSEGTHALALTHTQARTYSGLHQARRATPWDLSRTGFLLLLHYSLWNVVFISWFQAVVVHRRPRLSSITHTHTHREARTSHSSLSQNHFLENSF